MAISISIKTDSAGEFIDLFDNNDIARITDYSLIDKEMIFNGNKILLGEKRKRRTVNSIDELKKYIELFIQVTSTILASNNSASYTSEDMYSDIVISFPFDLGINAEEHKLLVEQIIVDVLFDKYLAESEKMTPSKYAEQMCALLADGTNKNYLIDSTRKSISRSMDQYYNMVKYSELKEELELLGINPDKYAEYYNSEIKDSGKIVKPKFIWDQLYYNRNLITYRQYRRQLTKANRNYPYNQAFNDFKEYGSFIEKLLPKDYDAPKKFFNQVMDYYALETYKRIDFMLELSKNILKANLTEINKIDFLVERFHPEVLTPYVDGDSVDYNCKIKNYRPAIMLEEALLQQVNYNNESSLSNIGKRLIRCQIVRAKVYELLNYHIEFISTDYGSFKAFLMQSYNLCSYHRKNELWQSIAKQEWASIDAQTKQQTEKLIRVFFDMNKFLFWPSKKRTIHAPQDEK